MYLYLGLMKNKKYILSFVVFLLLSLGGAMANAGVAEEISNLFVLFSQLRPGMPLEEVKSLMGPHEEETLTGNKAVPLKRTVWLKGETGIEVYSVEALVHKVNITLHFSQQQDTLKALDSLTRQGSVKYGSMPQFDHSAGQYYWVVGQTRLGFSKYSSTAIISTFSKSK